MTFPRIHWIALAVAGFASTSILGAEFQKDSKVRLTKDAPLLFKTEQARIGKAGETFTVIQHNTATNRVFLLATDAAGKQIALNVAADDVELLPAAKPAAKPEPADSVSEYVRKSKELVPDKADTSYAKSFEKGKLYTHTGEILQVTETMMMVDNAIEKRPWAILNFGDPKKVEGESISQGSMVQTIVRFEGFKDVSMVSGATMRLAQFTCVGFAIADGKNHYVDCSAQGADPAPPKAP